MADLRALKNEAAELAARGRLDRAAAVLREVLKADVRDVATRQRLAEVLRRAGRTGEAVVEYQGAAEGYARDGLLARAIALCKTILELDPGHGATQAALAELYAARERGAPPRAVAGPAVVPPPAAELNEPGEPPAATPLARIVQAAQAASEAGVEEDVALDLDGPPTAAAEEEAVLEAGPEAPAAAAPRGVPLPADMSLPRIPLFSDLSREAFIALTEGMALRRVRAGEAVLEEGEAGTSFFVVAGGELEVTRRDDRGERVRLARLREGDFFGEMAALSGARRLASVAALEDSEVLEIRAEDLLELAGRHPHLARSLRGFYQERILANAMALSPVFRPFSPDDRRRIMSRFQVREVSAGAVVIREGEPADGLYVVLDGALEVRRWQAPEAVTVAELREGDVFGEMSCLRKSPATATVAARRAGILLRLPRQGFDELVLSHPQILEVVSQLAEEREGSLDAILSGQARWTDEGLVLV